MNVLRSLAAMVASLGGFFGGGAPSPAPLPMASAPRGLSNVPDPGYHFRRSRGYVKGPNTAHKRAIRELRRMGVYVAADGAYRKYASRDERCAAKRTRRARRL